MFKDMCFFGLIDKNDKLHIELLKFCFIHLIQADITRMAIEWNTHRISARKHQHILSGIPDIMFFTPNAYDCISYHADVNIEDMMQFETEFELDEGEPDLYSPDMELIVNELLPNWKRPQTVEEAQNLYVELLGKIEQFENDNMQ